MLRIVLGIANRLFFVLQFTCVSEFKYILLYTLYPCCHDFRFGTRTHRSVRVLADCLLIFGVTFSRTSLRLCMSCMYVCGNHLFSAAAVYHVVCRVFFLPFFFVVGGVFLVADDDVVDRVDFGGVLCVLRFKFRLSIRVFVICFSHVVEG